MPTLTFRGRVDTSPLPPALGRIRNGSITPYTSAAVQLERGDARQEKVAVDEGQCVEIELAGGVRLWTRADDLQRDLGPASTRGTADAPFELPAVFPVGVATRSRSDLLLKGLKVFGVDLPGTAADYIANHLEGALVAGGELYQTSSTSAETATPAETLSGGSPTLVLLHGTASSTEGSFGELWTAVGGNRILRVDNPGARINGLMASYKERILAFQHRTLSESPIVNALALARRLAAILPDEAELHLVSHSRGGLIGELLSRGMRPAAAAFDATDLALFDDRPVERAALEELGRILREKRFRITRFVRVACPAAGTTLASGRLDRYFSMLVNVAGRIPSLAASPVFEVLTSTLAAILKERTNPERLPGLEAMMPESPLARMLNRKDILIDADLHVLGGDLAMGGILSTLTALATDFYYQEDHDLVVNTRSMLAGGPRRNGVKYWIDTGGEVTHFNYFRRGDTAARLCDALTASTADFHPLVVAPSDVEKDDYRKRAVEEQPLLVVVPDFMGTHLAVDGRRVWADTAELARGALGRLARGAKAEPQALVGDYRDLLAHLAHTHEVIPFPYDWRESVVGSADALTALLEGVAKQAAQAKQPVRILAHGSGGLVVRAMLGSTRGSKAWQAISAQAGSRIVLLGTPARGSHAMAALLTGRSELVQALSCIDLTRRAHQIVAILAGFPGLLEQLPEGGTEDCFGLAWWKELQQADRRSGWSCAWELPDEKLLTAARDARATLEATPFDGTRDIYVAGAADTTIGALAIEPGASGGPQVVLRGSPGDGRVTWALGIPDALRQNAFYASAEHGALVDDSSVFAAIADLLNRGTTTRLERVPPAGLRSATDAPPVRPPRVDSIPDDEGLVATALSHRRRRRTRRTTSKVRVSVVHGNLSRASSPVLVGHYQDDVFVSAEDYLDRQLEGRLRELHRMNLYPGPAGTAVVVVNELDERRRGIHPGAIVVGLGVVGELTPGMLSSTIENGLVMYGAERVGQVRRQRQRDEHEPEAGPDVVDAPVTALLVGSGEGGLNLSDCLHAVLSAVQRANQRLASPDEAQPVSDRPQGALTGFISAVDIFELYEDRAIEAVHALNQLSETSAFRDHFQANPRLTSGAEGRTRASFDETPAWWQRLRIAATQEAGKPGSGDPATRVLKFETLTNRARSDAFLTAGQKGPADAFIARASASTVVDPDLGRTLFEMLIPNELKEYAPDRRKLVLLLDDVAAAIPWELLQDGFDRRARPIAVESGMVRQLRVEDGRRRVQHATEPTALVIGDPRLTDPRFRRLPGATKEARAVAARLTADDYRVRTLTGEDAEPLAVLSALHAQPWRILHLAAHGVHKFRPTPDAEPVTGMVLADGVFLQSQDFNQMRFVPELVFVNCCHLGKGEATEAQSSLPFAHLAANVAAQFIRMGARAVIAAGWAVHDQAATTFGETFYAEMLSGTTFGDAVTRAREAAYDEFPFVNTWGAYQCYGDPAFFLRSGSAGARRRAFVSARELTLQADAIMNWAKLGKETDVAGLVRDLEDLTAQAASDWLKDARVCAALGAAYGELGGFPEAIAYYEQACRADRADVPLAAIEQLANLRARHAAQLWEAQTKRAGKDRKRTTKKGKESDVDPIAQLDRAERLLNALIDIAGTGERRSLKGSLLKRKARMVPPDEREGALEATAAAYWDAYVAKREENRSDAWYPLFNSVCADLAKEWVAGAAPARRKSPARRPGRPRTSRDSIDGSLKELRRLADALGPRPSGIWELSFLTDLTLVETLRHGKLSGPVRQDLARQYSDVRRRGASRREMNSVTEQIRFLHGMADDAGPSAGTVARDLKALLDAIDG